MQALILIIHVIAAISIIALVLLQHGKGADAGAAFGSGASGTMFGSTGALPFLIKLTAILAAIFFATSLALSYFATPHKSESEMVVPPSSVVPSSPTQNNSVVPSVPSGSPTKTENP